MQEAHSNGKVWISREEYERLQRAEQSQALLPYETQGLLQPNPYDVPAPADPLSAIQRQQLIVATVLGVGFVLSLSVSFLNWLTGAIVVVFCIFAAISLVQYLRAKSHVTRGQAVKQPRSTARVLLFIAGGVVLLPIMFIVGIIVLLIIMTTVGGGRGS